MGKENGVKPAAFQEGETVKFTDFVMGKIETKYGPSMLIEYAGADGEIHRKHFVPENSNLIELLRARPEATTVTLKKYLTSGEYKRPVWMVE